MELTAKDETKLDQARRVGEERGYVLNPDIARALKVANLLVRNHEEFGKYYCPCKQSHPLDPEEDVLCPCPAGPGGRSRRALFLSALLQPRATGRGRQRTETESRTDRPGGP